MFLRVVIILSLSLCFLEFIFLSFYALQAPDRIQFLFLKLCFPPNYVLLLFFICYNLLFFKYVLCCRFAISFPLISVTYVQPPYLLSWCRCVFLDTFPTSPGLLAYPLIDPSHPNLAGTLWSPGPPPSPELIVKYTWAYSFFSLSIFCL